jgi:uncharacterized protein YlxW (UPF0749 family)
LKKEMLKKIDYIIIFFICLVLGIFFVSQVYAGKKYEKIIQPENNEVLVLEVAKLTKSNADLRTEAKELTDDLDNYRQSNLASKDNFSQFEDDSKRLDLINGLTATQGQGLEITIKGPVTLPQIVDLINAIRNIGGEMIWVNGTRITTNSNLGRFIGANSIQIQILGNSHLLKSALERKGGIIEQLSGHEIKFNIEERESVNISVLEQSFKFHYAKIISI